jgi:predicted dehydrogenase
MAMGVHCVDLLCLLLGQEVVEVTAITDGQRGKAPWNVWPLCVYGFRGAVSAWCTVAASRSTIVATEGRAKICGATRDATAFRHFERTAHDRIAHS